VEIPTEVYARTRTRGRKKVIINNNTRADGGGRRGRRKNRSGRFLITPFEAIKELGNRLIEPPCRHINVS